MAFVFFTRLMPTQITRDFGLSKWESEDLQLITIGRIFRHPTWSNGHQFRLTDHIQHIAQAGAFVIRLAIKITVRQFRETTLPMHFGQFCVFFRTQLFGRDTSLDMRVKF
ncbi:Uncharacterised protein [Vibrio cholerae]|uniref:Uncharacterized protein n=1 Tax=Vibrio cholerae TaxID=666 RepID=A0A656AQF3_VIBCL|nr:Uncharacterised protein [Vibrio cholerae]CSB24343.1 Uncharacterised protein [Vibrio cholerae]CSB25366.1 Uncharacterised protein [Vibrio cholerae]CSB55859.1 Uncharacterised protein [Vibrio cholerae]CSB78662.1 Uncharacterised protein [Vibrio cholerae]